MLLLFPHRCAFYFLVANGNTVQVAVFTGDWEGLKRAGVIVGTIMVLPHSSKASFATKKFARRSWVGEGCWRPSLDLNVLKVCVGVGAEFTTGCGYMVRSWMDLNRFEKLFTVNVPFSYLQGEQIICLILQTWIHEVYLYFLDLHAILPSLLTLNLEMLFQFYYHS